MVRPIAEGFKSRKTFFSTVDGHPPAEFKLWVIVASPAKTLTLATYLVFSVLFKLSVNELIEILLWATVDETLPVLKLVLKTLEERFLDDNELICDEFTLWEDELKESLKKNENIDFKIYLKIQIHYNYGSHDTDSLSMSYYQVLINYLLYKECIRLLIR